MHKILVAVDGSENAMRALHHALKLVEGSKEAMELHVLNVQPDITFGDVKKYVSQEAINAYYQDEGIKMLQEPRKLLEQAGMPHTLHIGVGHAAETIANYARQHQCGQIVMGTRGHGAMSSLLLGSVATKVIHLADVPVTLVK